MKKHFLWIALCLLIIAGDAATRDGDPPRVVDVRVEGNTLTATEALLANVRTRIGAAYDPQIVREDERRLLATGRFDSVRATRTDTDQGIVVTFTVDERPIIRDIAFDGNREFTDAQLAALLPVAPGGPLNRYNIEAGRQAILSEYRESGYAFATVDADLSEVDKFYVIYQIVEGPQVAVRKIRFEGNEHFGNFRLRRAVGSKQRIWPIVSGHMDPEQIDLDVQTIRNMYLDAGFLDVEVGRLVELNDARDRATVTFVINEGPRFRVNELLFEGNTVFSGAELGERLPLARGEFFTTEDLRRSIEIIQTTYGELGFIDARVSASRRYLPPEGDLPAWATELPEDRPALLNVVFTIDEADQYRVGRIDIRGNTVTQGRVIRRNLRIFPEQLLNMAAIAESRQNLLETRLFDRVDLTPIGEEQDYRTVLVQVSEARTAEFLVGVGVSTNSGLLGNVSFTQRNFDILGWPSSWRDVAEGRAWKGAGQRLSIVAEPGTELMRFHVEWFEPALFDRPYSLGTKAFLFTRGREEYDETRYGGVLSVGHRFKNRWYGEISSRIEGIEIDNVDFSAPPEVAEVEGTHALIGTKGTLVRDRTDSRWMPSMGDRFTFSYEQVMGDFDFGRATGDYRIYRTLYVDALDRKHILAGRVAAGQIFGDAPVFEKFYGGGTGSVRGFEYRGISPRSAGTDDPIGGDFLLFAGAEYGFPIAGEQLRGVVFMDSGTVEEDFEITTYRVAVGAGLRILIPMMGPVPMSLDFAIPINEDEQDEEQLVSFTVGWTF